MPRKKTVGPTPAEQRAIEVTKALTEKLHRPPTKYEIADELGIGEAYVKLIRHTLGKKGIELKYFTTQELTKWKNRKKLFDVYINYMVENGRPPSWNEVVDEMRIDYQKLRKLYNAFTNEHEHIVEIINAKNKRVFDRQKKIIEVYNELLPELEKHGMKVFPSREELVEKTGCTEGEIIVALRNWKKDGYDIKMSSRDKVTAWKSKVMIIEALERVSSETGKTYDGISNPEIEKYIDLSHNTVQKYRIELEKGGILELRKCKKTVIENKKELPKLKEKLIDLAKGNLNLSLKELAKDLNVVWHRIARVRNVLADEGKIPKTAFRKADKYEQIQSIIKVYKENPNLPTLTEWTKLAGVPFGTFYKRIDEIALDPEFSNIDVPKGMIERVRNTSTLERLLGAISNYDRVEILDILSTGKSDVDEITKLRDKPIGWRANTLDHIRMLQFAGLVEGPPYKLTDYGDVIHKKIPGEEYDIGFTSYQRPLILLALGGGDATSRELVKRMKVVKGLGDGVEQLWKESLRPHHKTNLVEPIDGEFLVKEDKVYSLTEKAGELVPFLMCVEELSKVVKQPYQGIEKEEVGIRVYDMFLDLMAKTSGYREQFIDDILQRIEKGDATMEELGEIPKIYNLQYKDLNKIIYKLQDLGVVSIRIPESGERRREKNVLIVSRSHDDKYERSFKKMKGKI